MTGSTFQARRLGHPLAAGLWLLAGACHAAAAGVEPAHANANANAVTRTLEPGVNTVKSTSESTSESTSPAPAAGALSSACPPDKADLAARSISALEPTPKASLMLAALIAAGGGMTGAAVYAAVAQARRLRAGVPSELKKPSEEVPPEPQTARELLDKVLPEPIGIDMDQSAPAPQTHQPIAATPPTGVPVVDTAPAPAPRLSCVADPVLIAIAQQWGETDAPTAAMLEQLHLPATLGSSGARAGMVSVTGPVRSRNEDACIFLTLDDGRMLLMSADGMGGHADGHLASRLALVGACVGLREALARSPDVTPDRLLRHVFSWSRRLLQYATSQGQLDPGAGTTLIATLVECDHYVTAYLGDGGAFVRRCDATLEPLMQAQKTTSTVLDRYLAAVTPERWAPVITMVVRQRGDTLMIGSDGVMDRVAIGEVMNWLAASVATKGLSMPQALRQLVDHFADLKTREGNLIADDNMSLVAVRMPG